MESALWGTILLWQGKGTTDLEDLCPFPGSPQPCALSPMLQEQNMVPLE